MVLPEVEPIVSRAFENLQYGVRRAFSISQRLAVSGNAESRPTFTRFLHRLPAELRIWIAQYGMTGDRPLKWMYTTCMPNRRVGTFKHLEQLTALRWVLKLLYEETSGLAGKRNEFELDVQDFGIAHKVRGSMLRGGNSKPIHALQMFYDNAPIEALCVVKTVCIKVLSLGIGKERHRRTIYSVDIIIAQD